MGWEELGEFGSAMIALIYALVKLAFVGLGLWLIWELVHIVTSNLH